MDHPKAGSAKPKSNAQTRSKSKNNDEDDKDFWATGKLVINTYTKGRAYHFGYKGGDVTVGGNIATNNAVFIVFNYKRIMGPLRTWQQHYDFAIASGGRLPTNTEITDILTKRE